MSKPTELLLVVIMLVLAFSVVETALGCLPILTADKRSDKDSVNVGDIVTVTIEVTGSGDILVCDAIDLIFVVDTSCSFDPELRILRPIFMDLISNLSLSCIDLRIGVIVFGGFHYYSSSPIRTDGSADPLNVRQLSCNTSLVIDFVSSLKGCGGGWEPWGDAIWLANHWADWRENACKIVVLATDEITDEGRKVPGPLDRTTGENYNGTALWNEVSTANSNGLAYIGLGSGYAIDQLKLVTRITKSLYYNISTLLVSDLVNAVNSLREVAAGQEVTVTDTISNEVEIIAGSPNIPPDNQIPNPDGTVTFVWHLGRIEIGESVQINYQVRMITCGVIPLNTEAKVDCLDWEGNAASIILPVPTVTVIEVIPEYPLGAVLSIMAFFAAFVAVCRSNENLKRKST